jgi:superfamily II DNA or RNA helicase
LAAFKAANNRGTICLSTGTGKGKIALDFIKEQENVLNVLITSPRTNLKENWRKELVKWGFTQSILTKDDGVWMFHRDDGSVWSCRITIENIQTVYKWWNKHFDFIIADEIHTMMTPEFSKLFYKTKYEALMGLTATHDINGINDKAALYRKYCPIIYEYYGSAEDGIINKTRFFVVNHHLNNVNIAMVGPKKKRFPQGELKAYEYLTEQIKKGQKGMLAQGSDDWFTDAANWFWKDQGDKDQKLAAMKYLNAIKFRKDFLLNLSSSARLAIKIKRGILTAQPKAKILLFSELTAQANKLTEHTVHSHNSDAVNAMRIKHFDDGAIRELGSCQSLTLGLNLKGATHAIMESYISSATRSKQKKGRLDRLATDEVADMWIIRIMETQSANWFEKMVKDFDMTEAMYIDSGFILNDQFDYGKRQASYRT